MDDPTPKQTEPKGIDLWLMPFFRDSSLWPVLAVIVLCLTTVGAGVLLTAWLSRNPFALAALLLLALMSGDIAIRAHRRGKSRVLLWCVIGFWLGSVAMAVVGIAAGIV